MSPPDIFHRIADQILKVIESDYRAHCSDVLDENPLMQRAMHEMFAQWRVNILHILQTNITIVGTSQVFAIEELVRELNRLNQNRDIV